MAAPLIPVVLNTGTWLMRLAPKLNIPGRLSDVLNFAKANPTTFLLAAKETYDTVSGFGPSLFDTLMQQAPEELQALLKQSNILDIVGAFAPVDKVRSGVLDQLDELEDEMISIDHAVRVLGSYDNLQAVRRVLTMDDAHFATYIRLRRISRVVS